MECGGITVSGGLLSSVVTFSREKTQMGCGLWGLRGVPVLRAALSRGGVSSLVVEGAG